MNLRRYERRGILAIDPRAFLEMFSAAGDPKIELRGDIAIVPVTGPLENEPGWFDSYGAIVERVKAACASSASTVLLKVDSPGGQVSGCFDAARTIRSVCAEAGKTLIAFVSGCACSAAYALAAAASQIVLAESALAGSIGIIDMRVDATAADAAMGLRFTPIASGARKADGNPHVPITDAELAASQGLVNSLAQTFFALVAELRGVSADAIAGMEARIFHGEAAMGAGLADQVQSLESLLASIASGGATMADEKSDYQSAREALGKLAAGDGEEAVKARRALAAMDGPGDDEEEEEEEDGEKKPDAEGDPPAAQASARVSASSAVDLAVTVQNLSAEVTSLKAENEATKRSHFLASRPDLSKDLVAVLSTKPLAEVRAIVDAIPKPAALAATASVQGTRGEGQVSSGDARRPDLRGKPYGEAMARAFGYTLDDRPPVRMEGNTMVLGPMTPEQARKRVEELQSKGRLP